MSKTPTEIRSLARSHTQNAIKTLAGIMMQRKTAPAARVAAATALLDRGWGKPSQTMEHSGPDGGPIDLVARLLGDIDGKTRALNEKAE